MERANRKESATLAKAYMARRQYETPEGTRHNTASAAAFLGVNVWTFRNRQEGAGWPALGFATQRQFKKLPAEPMAFVDALGRHQAEETFLESDLQRVKDWKPPAPGEPFDVLGVQRIDRCGAMIRLKCGLERLYEYERQKILKPKWTRSLVTRKLEKTYTLEEVTDLDTFGNRPTTRTIDYPEETKIIGPDGEHYITLRAAAKKANCWPGTLRKASKRGELLAIPGPPRFGVAEPFYKERGDKSIESLKRTWEERKRKRLEAIHRPRTRKSKKVQRSFEGHFSDGRQNLRSLIATLPREQQRRPAFYVEWWRKGVLKGLQKQKPPLGDRGVGKAQWTAQPEDFAAFHAKLEAAARSDRDPGAWATAAEIVAAVAEESGIDPDLTTQILVRRRLAEFRAVTKEGVHWYRPELPIQTRGSRRQRLHLYQRDRAIAFVLRGELPGPESQPAKRQRGRPAQGPTKKTIELMRRCYEAYYHGTGKMASRVPDGLGHPGMKVKDKVAMMRTYAKRYAALPDEQKTL